MIFWFCCYFCIIFRFASFVSEDDGEEEPPTKQTVYKYCRPQVCSLSSPFSLQLRSSSSIRRGVEDDVEDADDLRGLGKRNDLCCCCWCSSSGREFVYAKRSRKISKNNYHLKDAFRRSVSHERKRYRERTREGTSKNFLREVI